MLRQHDLFETALEQAPPGLRYHENALAEEEERAAILAIRTLDLAPFVFGKFLGKRRVASFGWRFDYQGGGLQKASPMPAFVRELRDRVANLSGVRAGDFVQALVTEYAPGAGIGWHRDKPHFGKVAALSFGAPCDLRFRRRTDEGWERRTVPVAPRSFYLLDGPARRSWEHSIAAMPALRYSITFRTLSKPHA